MADEPDTTTSDTATSDTTTSDTTTSDTEAEPTSPSHDADQAASASPAPRPRSATSRARRIGGAATPAPKPSAAAENSGETSSTGSSTGSSSSAASSTAKKSAGKTTAASVSLGKKRGSDADGDEELDAPARVSLPSWAVWAPSAAFAAVAVVFLVLFAVARIGGPDEPDTTSSQLRQQVLAGAKNCLATLNTYRYDKLDAAEAAGVECTTGKLTTDYEDTVKNIIRKNAPSLKAVQQAKINTAGIESVTSNGKQWTVLAYGQISITTSQQSQGRVDPFAVLARMQQVKGKWVLSKIDTVSSFSS